MKRSQAILRLTGLLMVAALLITACGPAATATPAPQPTAVPATDVPPTEAEAAFEPLSQAAPSCDYGEDGDPLNDGEFLSIEAVDEYTVKMTLCRPDPAFPSKVA